MARHPTNNSQPETGAKDGEHIEVLNHETEPGDVPLEDVNDEARAVIVADATAKNPEPAAEAAPEVRYYRVIKGGPVLMPNGMRTVLKEGKVFNNLNYDPRRLQMQGIKLERAETEQSSMIFVE